MFQILISCEINVKLLLQEKYLYSFLSQEKYQNMAQQIEYQVLAEVYRCFLNCDNNQVSYSICLRIGSKCSEESRKTIPFNNTLIQFNQNLLLNISEIQIKNAHKCQILLFKYKINSQKEIIAIASIHIDDLTKGQRRKLRLINNQDKCALIQLKILMKQLYQPTYQNSSYSQQNWKIQKGIRKLRFEKHIPEPDISYDRKQHIKQKLSSQGKNQHLNSSKDDKYSDISGTKTCPQYHKQNRSQIQLQKERKFSRKKQNSEIGHSNKKPQRKSSDNYNHYSHIEIPKYAYQQIISPFPKLQRPVQFYKRQEESQQNFNRTQIVEKKTNIINTDWITQKIQKLENLSKIFQQQNSNNKQSQCRKVSDQNLVKFQKRKDLTFQKSLNLHIQGCLKRKSPLRMHPAVMNFSFKYDYDTKVALVQRETNTQTKNYMSIHTQTLPNEKNNQQTSTFNLKQQIQQQIQTDLQLLVDLQNRIQILNESSQCQQSFKPSFVQNKVNQTSITETKRRNIEQFAVQTQSISIIQFNESTLQIKQNILSNAEIGVQTEQYQPQSNYLSEKQTFLLDKPNSLMSRLQIQSIGNNSKSGKQSLMEEIIFNDLSSNDEKDGVCKSSSRKKSLHLQPVTLRQMSSGKFVTFLDDQHRNPSQYNFTPQKNAILNQNPTKTTSLSIKNSYKRDSEHYSLVNTVAVCIRSLRLKQRPSINSIVISQRPKSNFQKIGHIKSEVRRQKYSQNHIIHQMNEQLHQTKINEFNSNQNLSSKQNKLSSMGILINGLGNTDRSENQSFKMYDFKVGNQELDQSEEYMSSDADSQIQSDFSNDTNQDKTQQYSNRKDFPLQNKDKNNQFKVQLRQTNKILQKTNDSIKKQFNHKSKTLKLHLDDCILNKVSKNQYIKLQIELSDLKKQLRNLQSQTQNIKQQKISIQETNKYLTQTVDKMKSQNDQLKKNLKILKDQLHFMQAENSERETQKEKVKFSNQSFYKQYFVQNQSNQVSQVQTKKQKIKQTGSVILGTATPKSQMENSSFPRHLDKRVSILDALLQSKNLPNEQQIAKQNKQKPNFRSFVARKVQGKQGSQSPSRKSINKFQTSKTIYKSAKFVSRESSYFSNFPSIQIEDFITNQKTSL